MKTAILILIAALIRISWGQDPPQYGTPFNGVPDPRDASIYQVNIRAFSESGGFQGVTARLDQIQSLGVNILYLMPHTPVGIEKTANSPYCVRNYKEVNPEFGSLEDLRILVQEAHKRGMAVILDWVANHTAWDHPWIKAHADWYERDANGVIQPAKVNDFVWNDVAKLDFAVPEMRLAMIDALRYWVLAVNSDGYRFDFTDGPPIEFWQQANSNLRGIAGRKLILYAEGGRFSNYTAFDYNHGFSFYDGLKQMFGGQQETALKVEGENEYHYQQSGESNRIVRYVTNHDVNGWDGPPQTLLGGQAGTMAAFVLAAYNKGVPLIYNGQEIALDYALKFPFTGQTIHWNPNKAVTDEYIKLIRFRNASEAIRRAPPISFSNKDVSAFIKKTAKEKALVIVNIRNRTVQYALPPEVANTTWYDGFEKTPIKFGATLELKPYQYLAATAAPLTVRNIGVASSKSGTAAIAARVGSSILTLSGILPGTVLQVRDVTGKSSHRSIASRESARIDLRSINAGVHVLTLSHPDMAVPYAWKFLR
jgi:glycosidase